MQYGDRSDAYVAAPEFDREEVRGQAWIFFAVDDPSAQVYVDGSLAGSSAEFNKNSSGLAVTAGLHRIEVVSSGRESFSAVLTLEPGHRRLLRHDFHTGS